MPRPNPVRTIGGEDNLAERIAMERASRGWTYADLAERMTDAGCAIHTSALYKIEKGAPRRKISVDELVALARVFDSSVEDMLTPVSVLQTARAKELLEKIDGLADTLRDTLAEFVTAMAEFYRLETEDPDVFDYVNYQRFTPGPDDTVTDLEDADHLSDVQKALISLHAAAMSHAQELAKEGQQ